MDKNNLTLEQLNAYKQYLLGEERSAGTIKKYLRDVQSFCRWLKGRSVTKEIVVEWKTYLLSQNYAPITINGMLSALNGLFVLLGWKECRVKFLKIQRKIFQDSRRELTFQEYIRLVETARSQGKERLALLMEAICSTGIRVSEVKYLTVESARMGKAEISLKGKVRTILIPKKLANKLLKYAKKCKIASGEIFLTGGQKSVSRCQIWSEMKSLCQDAQVDAEKVFPHNLRHLFAISFYKVCKDIVRLADVLGHSSVETTRIYLVTSGTEHAHMMERLRLVL